MASKKKSARKSAAKRTAKTATERSAEKPNIPKQPSAADRKAQAKAQVPIEPVGPGVEHEDHEGGETDSLAKKGVRGPLLTQEEKDEAAKKEEVVRAPSVRERQTGLGAVIARGGYRGVRDTVDAKGNVVPAQRGAAAAIAARKGSKIVPVVARALGQYPADGRLRAPGEAFDYVMQDDEKKLPSWVVDPSGAIESREPGEVIGGPTPSTFIEVRGARAENVSVRAGEAPETAAANRANRATSVI